jgi:hypothetical protein
MNGRPSPTLGGRSWVLILTVWCGLQCGPVPVDAQMIDRMLAIVNGRVITLGDVRQHRLLAGIFGDPVPDEDREVVDEIIEDMLVDEQIRQFAAIGVSEAEVDAYLSALGDHPGVSAEVIRPAARARLVRQRFFEARFQRFSEATPAEITTYYETVFRPAAVAAGLDPVPPLDGRIRGDIERNIIIEKADSAFSEWIALRIRRSAIEVVD